MHEFDFIENNQKLNNLKYLDYNNLQINYYPENFLVKYPLDLKKIEYYMRIRSVF